MPRESVKPTSGCICNGFSKDPEEGSDLMNGLIPQ